MRILLYLLLISGVMSLPFAFIRQQWAVNIWRRVRLLLAIYALVILVSAIVSLIFRWDLIYG